MIKYFAWQFVDQMVSNVPNGFKCTNVRHILYFDTASERTEMKHFSMKCMLLGHKNIMI